MFRQNHDSSNKRVMAKNGFSAVKGITGRSSLI